MSKYSYQLKLEIIHKHQEGYGPTYLAKTYGFKLGTIKNWLKQYQLHGEEGLQKSLSKTVYSGEFKLSVLQYRQLHQLTYAQTAKHFGIKQGATIAGWNKVYLTQGYDGLCKPIGRPSKKAEDSTMTHKPSKQPLASSEKEELLQLRQENLYLKAELAYQKKLEALVRKKQHTKRKRP